MKFEIYKGYMEDLEARLEKIQKKCKKLGCDFHYEVIEEITRKVTVPDSLKTVELPFVIIETAGTAKVDGWEFVGEVDHGENGNVVLTAGNIDIPEKYYHSECTCDHCKTKRIRRSTYIVRNADGEFRQVGKLCLKEYTGISAEAAALAIEYREIFSEAENYGIDEIFEKFSRNPYYSTESVLKVAIEAVKYFGYVKSENYGTSTKDVTISWLNKPYASRSEYLECGSCAWDMENFKPEENEEEAKKIIEWGKVIDSAETGYLANVRAVLSNKYCEPKHIGIAVSAVKAYERYLENERRKAEHERNKSSEYLGEVGKKIQVTVKSARLVTSYDNYYGMTTYIFEIVTSNGNVIIWKTSSGRINTKEIKQMIATVKEHKEYEGVKQTVVTRPKFN